jgi:hypothetical protein
MKRFVLASAVLVAAIGTASAATINSNTVTIWSADTPGANSGSASQQGLPTATGLFGGPLPLVAASTPFNQPINYNDTNGNTIGGFFASDSPAAPIPATCNATCAAIVLSTGAFSHATVFEFTFTVATSGTFSANHDDGISLFLAGTENLTNSNNLLPLAASAPTTVSPSSVFILAGTYDLWYSEVNGLPAVLQASFTPSVPEPATWGMMLLGFAGLGFAFRQSRRKVSFA